MDKQLQKDIKEFQNLAKQFSSSAEIAKGLTDAAALNMKKINDLSKQNTAEAKKEKKFREDISDLSKDILENTQNIGTEEFKILDVAQKLAKARRMGDKELVKQLSHLKSINQQQKQMNKQISAAADLAAKPFEAIDSFIKEIPVVGELLSASIGAGGWADSIRQGTIEGVTSGIAENANLGKRLQGFFGKAFSGGVPIAKSTGKPDRRYKNAENASAGLLANINGAKIALGATAALAALAASKMISFANETGLGYTNLLQMAGPLLFNSNAVKAFANEMGTVNNLTTLQSIQLKIQEKLYGLSAENAAKLFATQRGITGATMDQFLTQTKSTANLARQAGVAPTKVFEDMAQNAESLALFSDATGDNMRDAAIQAAKFGLSLSDSVKMAEGLMDFESAIGKEMEASVLLGKQVNFNKARELFMANDIEGANEAVRQQLVGIGDLSELNYVQRKAIADATNMEFSAISKLVAPQKSAAEAAEAQKKSLIGAVVAGAAIGALLIGTMTAIGGALWGSLTFGLLSGKAVKSGIKGAGKGLGYGALAGGVLGGIAGAAGTGAKDKLASLSTGGDIKSSGLAEVHSGESVGNLAKVEKRLHELVVESKRLRSQNEVLMNRLTNRVGDLALS